MASTIPPGAAPQWRFAAAAGAAAMLGAASSVLLHDPVAVPTALLPVMVAVGTALVGTWVIPSRRPGAHDRQSSRPADDLVEARLQEIEALRSEIVTTVCHELRTPLTPIRGYAEMLLHDWNRFDDAQRRELLAQTVRHSDEVAKVLEDFVEFAELEATLDALRPVSLHLASEVEEQAHEVARTEGRSLSLDVDHRVWVLADRSALRAVMGHLVSNAVSYSPPDGTISIRARRAGSDVVVAVVDEGPGIPPAARELVFEPFYRHRGPALARRGAGLGLSTVRAYVERMGGRAWVEETPGGGSATCFALPLGSPPRGRRLPRRTEHGGGVMARTGTPRP